MIAPEYLLVGLLMINVTCLLWKAGDRVPSIVQGLTGILFFIIAIGKYFA